MSVQKPANEQQPGDVLVTPAWAGNMIYVGRQTGRLYGVLGAGKQTWMSPDDLAAHVSGFTVVPPPADESIEQPADETSAPAEAPKRRR